jgi:hypothetical protein
MDQPAAQPLFSPGGRGSAWLAAPAAYEAKARRFETRGEPGGLGWLGESDAPGGVFNPPEGFDSVLLRRQRSFLDALGKREDAGVADPFNVPAEGESAPMERARAAAADFVATAFITPLLAQLRSSQSAAPPFAPGALEKQFRPIADAQVARQVAHASRFPLVESVARSLLRQGGADRAGADATVSE